MTRQRDGEIKRQRDREMKRNKETQRWRDKTYIDGETQGCGDR
jgi:hypothetical protein